MRFENQDAIDGFVEQWTQDFDKNLYEDFEKYQITLSYVIAMWMLDKEIKFNEEFDQAAFDRDSDSLLELAELA